MDYRITAAHSTIDENRVLQIIGGAASVIGRSQPPAPVPTEELDALYFIDRKQEGFSLHPDKSNTDIREVAPVCVQK